MSAFEKAVADAGFAHLSYSALAQRLSVGVPYISQLLRGEKPLSGKIKAKLDALIAARGDGTAEVETVDVAFMTAPHPILTPTNELSSWCEPADLPPASDYAVIDATDGTAVLVEILARFNNHTAARKICQKLNKEAG